jgi:hypothetical protein
MGDSKANFNHSAGKVLNKCITFLVHVVSYKSIFITNPSLSLTKHRLYPKVFFCTHKFPYSWGTAFTGWGIRIADTVLPCVIVKMRLNGFE